MRLESVGQLLREDAVSHQRLSQALCSAAPQAVCALRASPARASVSALATSVLAALPAALDVDIRECLLYRWLPLLGRNNPAHDVIQWALRPRLEWMIEGRLTEIVLAAYVHLSQREIRIQRQEAHVQFGANGKAWNAKLVLSVGDAGTNASAVFYERSAEIYLPDGPWMM